MARLHDAKRKLVLLRHAKSSWDDAALDDHARPLKARGFHDCELMAPLLKKLGYDELPVYASDAARVMQTVKTLGSFIGWKQRVSFDAALYSFEPRDIWRYLAGFDRSHPALLLAGHNPALTDFINQACGMTVLDNLPTCGMVELLWPQADWAAIRPGSARLAYQLYPKLLRG